MADIELVIKIPEKWFDDMVREEFEDVDELCAVIQHSIQLPKGHGKLIDADEEIQRFCGKVCGCTLEECGYGFYCPLVKRMISAPAIIEKDKKQEDNGVFDEIMDESEDGEVYEKIKEIIDKVKE